MVEYIIQNLNQGLPQLEETRVIITAFIPNAEGNFKEDLNLLDELDLSTNDKNCIIMGIKVVGEDYKKPRWNRGDELFYYNKEDSTWYKLKIIL